MLQYCGEWNFPPPQEDPAVISAASDLVLYADEAAQGDTIMEKCADWGNYKYKNGLNRWFCNNYVRKTTGKSYGFFSEIIIYYEL